MVTPTQDAVLYPTTQWTAFNNALLDSFASLSSVATTVILLVMYDAVSHRKKRSIRASLTDVARMSGFDARTVKSSLRESLRKGLLDFNVRGTDRSRTNKTAWTVPLAEFNWADGHWTPVPRFLIRQYLPVVPRAIILPLIIKHQQLSWTNRCWPSVATLARLTNRSDRWIYLALRELSNERVWARLGTGLPRPLELWYRTKNGRHRHYYRARSVFYRNDGPHDSPTVSLAREFFEFFVTKKTAKPNRNKGRSHA
jgi:hypothetical protein